MKRDEKKEYQKPEITQHDNLSKVTKGGVGGSGPFGQRNVNTKFGAMLIKREWI